IGLGRSVGLSGLMDIDFLRQQCLATYRCSSRLEPKLSAIPECRRFVISRSLVFGRNSSPTTSVRTAMVIEFPGLPKTFGVCDAISVAKWSVIPSKTRRRFYCFHRDNLFNYPFFSKLLSKQVSVYPRYGNVVEAC